MDVIGRPSIVSDDLEYMPAVAGYAAAAVPGSGHSRRAAAGRGLHGGGGGGDSDFDYDGSDSDYGYSDDSSGATGARRRRKNSSMGVRKPGGAGATRVLHRWTAEEHARLEALVRQYGTERNWAVIAEGIRGRSGKQCRERWLNHLREGIIKGNWLADEEFHLALCHALVGNQWSQHCSRLRGRTENSIKNFWNATLRSKQANKRRGFLWSYIDKVRGALDDEGLRHRAFADTVRAIYSHNANWLPAWLRGRLASGELAVPAPGEGLAARGWRKLLDREVAFLRDRESDVSGTGIPYPNPASASFGVGGGSDRGAGGGGARGQHAAAGAQQRQQRRRQPQQQAQEQEQQHAAARLRRQEQQQQEEQQQEQEQAALAAHMSGQAQGQPLAYFSPALAFGPGALDAHMDGGHASGGHGGHSARDDAGQLRVAHADLADDDDADEDLLVEELPDALMPCGGARAAAAAAMHAAAAAAAAHERSAHHHALQQQHYLHGQQQQQLLLQQQHYQHHQQQQQQAQYEAQLQEHASAVAPPPALPRLVITAPQAAPGSPARPATMLAAAISTAMMKGAAAQALHGIGPDAGCGPAGGQLSRDSSFCGSPAASTGATPTFARLRLAGSSAAGAAGGHASPFGSAAGGDAGADGGGAAPAAPFMSGLGRAYQPSLLSSAQSFGSDYSAAGCAVARQGTAPLAVFGAGHEAYVYGGVQAQPQQHEQQHRQEEQQPQQQQQQQQQQHQQQQQQHAYQQLQQQQQYQQLPPAVSQQQQHYQQQDYSQQQHASSQPGTPAGPGACSSPFGSPHVQSGGAFDGGWGPAPAAQPQAPAAAPGAAQAQQQQLPALSRFARSGCGMAAPSHACTANGGASSMSAGLQAAAYAGAAAGGGDALMPPPPRGALMRHSAAGDEGQQRLESFCGDDDVLGPAGPARASCRGSVGSGAGAGACGAPAARGGGAPPPGCAIAAGGYGMGASGSLDALLSSGSLEGGMLYRGGSLLLLDGSALGPAIYHDHAHQAGAGGAAACPSQLLGGAPHAGGRRCSSRGGGCVSRLLSGGKSCELAAALNSLVGGDSMREGAMDEMLAEDLTA